MDPQVQRYKLASYGSHAACEMRHAICERRAGMYGASGERLGTIEGEWDFGRAGGRVTLQAPNPSLLSIRLPDAQLNRQQIDSICNRLCVTDATRHKRGTLSPDAYCKQRN